MAIMSNYIATSTSSVSALFGISKSSLRDFLTLTFGWSAYFNNTRWTPVSGEWYASTYWLSGTDTDLILSESGTWVEGYRPTQCRITYAAAYTLRFIAITNSDGTITYGTGPTGTMSSATFNLDCSGDIGRLYSLGDWYNDHYISNIEFC